MIHEPIPLSRPYVTEAERQAVDAVLKTDRLSIGAHTEGFENLAARKAGRQYGIAVNSGTSALHLIVKSLGIADGDEVITTPFSFIATTNCVLFERAKPVFVDIDPISYNMDPAAAEKAITRRTKALLPVNVFGNCAHMDAYETIARKHGLAMIEDCCEALGGSWMGRPAGNFGQAGAFAFYPNKQITTGEGGMVVTDSQDIRDLCRSLRNQGRDTHQWLSHARMGYNYRMSEISAALGEVQMARLEEILARRREAAELYDLVLGGMEEIHLPPMSDRQQASWFVYVIRLADKYSQADRDAVLEELRAKGIGCNNYFAPIHLQPYIMKMLGTKCGDFPVTEHIAARTIALPFFCGLTKDQAQRVRDVLAGALRATGR